MWVIILKDIK